MLRNDNDNIKELIILDNKNSKNDNKRLVATFKLKNGKTIRRKFGFSKALSTYADGANEEKRNAYIARHEVNEDFDNLITAGSLSKIVLWTFRKNNEIEKYYNRKYKIPKVKVDFKRRILFSR